MTSYPHRVSRAAASSAGQPVMSVTIRAARARSFSLFASISTIRLPYTLPSRIITPVDSMFSTIFWAVPDFIRVEPSIASGPVRGAMVTVAKRDNAVSGLLHRPTVRHPASFACAIAPST